jgi:hypothetical protein
LSEDRALEALERRTGLDAQFPDEQLAGLLVGRERVGLASGPVEGEHELAAKALAVRMAGDEGFELGDEVAAVPELQLGIDSLLDRLQAQLVEPGDLRLREGLEAEVGERLPPPEVECLPQSHRSPGGISTRPELAAGLHELLEAVEIELTGGELDEIARSTGANTLGAERLTQPGDVDLERLPRGLGRALSPELVDQALGADDLVGVQEQDRQRRSLLAGAERDLAVAVLPNLERPEDPELHRVLNGR